MKDIWARIATRRLLPLLFAVMLGLSFGLTGCQEATPVSLPVVNQPSPVKLGGRLSEVAPPAAIQSLRQALDVYQPQVAIVSPRPDEVLSATTVNVRFQVRDLPIFKDEALGLGPHLHVILDNQPYQAVYNLDQPLVFKDLEPGTHTLRVFASRPWHESFKNDGAYAQVTFHVLTQTATNRPDPKLPVLTYSSPQGRYGAEPILLDFYLANAPLQIPTAASEADLSNWRIRCTINGESFILDNWQPIYLKGFQRGDNWIKLEFLNDRGELVLNAFNNPTRLIQYEPGGKDPLSRLMRGELSASAAQGIVTQTLTTPALQPAAPVTPKPAAPPPVATPTPTAVPKPIVTPQPSPPAATDTSPSIPAEVKPVTTPVGSPAPAPTASPAVEAVPSRETAPAAAAPVETVLPRRATAPAASPDVPIAPPPPTPKTDGSGTVDTPALPKPDVKPAIEAQPAARSSPAPAADRSPDPSEKVTPPASAASPSASTPEDTPEDTPPTAPRATSSPMTQVNQWFSRLRDRLPAPVPSSAPPSPAPIAAPVAAPTPTVPAANATDESSGQFSREDIPPTEAAPALPQAPATVPSPPPTEGAAIAP